MTTENVLRYLCVSFLIVAAAILSLWYPDDPYIHSLANVLIIVPIYTRPDDDLDHIEQNIKSIANQGHPVKFVLQNNQDSILPVLKESNLDYMFSPPLKSKISNKVNNQLAAIDLLPSDTTIITFVDADVRLKENAINDLIKPILDGSKISTGCRIVNNNSILNSWSHITSAYKYGIYGGLFAVNREWFMKNAIDTFSQSYADDWAVILSAQRTKTEIYHTDIPAYCKQKSVFRFLIRQYSWVKFYAPKMFYLSLAIQPLLILLSPIIMMYIWTKSKSFKSGLATLVLPFVIIYVQLVAMHKRHINWSGSKIEV